MPNHRLVSAAVAFVVLAAGPAGAVDGCMDPLPELTQMMQRATIDEITREKIEDLLEEAAELCEQGKLEEAETKYTNVRELLESDIES